MPPWVIGSITLPHVTAHAYHWLPAQFRDALTAFYWGPCFMAAFPDDRDWHVASEVTTDLACWLAFTVGLGAPALFATVEAFLPQARAIADATPRPVLPPPLPVTAPDEEPQREPPFRLGIFGWPQCPHGLMRRIPAGISRNGRPYSAFWGCPAYACDTRNWDLPAA